MIEAHSHEGIKDLKVFQYSSNLSRRIKVSSHVKWSILINWVFDKYGISWKVHFSWVLSHFQKFTLRDVEHITVAPMVSLCRRFAKGCFVSSRLQSICTRPFKALGWVFLTSWKSLLRPRRSAMFACLSYSHVFHCWCCDPLMFKLKTLHTEKQPPLSLQTNLSRCFFRTYHCLSRNFFITSLCFDGALSTTEKQ